MSRARERGLLIIHRSTLNTQMKWKQKLKFEWKLMHCTCEWNIKLRNPHFVSKNCADLSCDWIALLILFWPIFFSPFALHLESVYLKREECNICYAVVQRNQLQNAFSSKNFYFVRSCLMRIIFTLHMLQVGSLQYGMEKVSHSN